METLAGLLSMQMLEMQPNLHKHLKLKLVLMVMEMMGGLNMQILWNGP